MSYQQVRQKVKVVGSAVSAPAAVVCPRSRSHCGCLLDRQQGTATVAVGEGALEEQNVLRPWKVGL